MSNKIAKAGTAGICDHRTLSLIVIIQAFTGYCRLQTITRYAGFNALHLYHFNGVHMYPCKGGFTGLANFLN